MCRITHTWARDPRGWADHWGHCGTQEQALADEMGHFLGQQQDGCVSTSLAGHGFHFGDVTGTTAVNSSHFFNEMWGLSHSWVMGLLQQRSVKATSPAMCCEGRRFILCKITGRNLFWSFSERRPPGWQAALSLCSALPGICTCKMHKIRTSLHLPNSL